MLTYVALANARRISTNAMLGVALAIASGLVLFSCGGGSSSNGDDDIEAVQDSLGRGYDHARDRDRK